MSDFLLPPLGSELTRSGSVDLEDATYLGYADEARREVGPGAIEVMAEVPSYAMLPDNFGYSDLKFGKVKELFEAPSYSLKSSWAAELRKIRIYVIDPKGIVSTVTRYVRAPEVITPLTRKVYDQDLSNEVARLLSFLNPNGWVHTLDLMDGIQLYGLRDFDRFDQIRKAELAQARSKKGDFLTNTRRRLLRIQALNRPMLAYQPYRVDLESGELKVSIRELPIRSVAQTLGTRITYDKGHSADLPILIDGQRRKEPLVRRLREQYKFPFVDESGINEADSIAFEHIQLADFSAGLAFDLYTDSRRRDELVQTFKQVFVNGALMT